MYFLFYFPVYIMFMVKSDIHIKAEFPSELLQQAI